MTVAENLRVGLHRTESKSLVAAMLGLPSHQRSVAGPSLVCPGSGYQPGGVSCVMPPPYEPSVKEG